MPYIKKADVYVQTSRTEGYGLAIAEARVLKKLIIATNLECVAEQIEDKVNGFLIDFNEYEFAERLEDIINETESVKKSEKI